VLHGLLLDAHVPRHALALEDAARRLALSDGAHVPVHLVRRGGVARLALHVVALDDARETHSARSPGDVDLVALLEQLDGDLRADREIPELFLRDAELADRLVRLLRLLLELPEERLGLAALGFLL